MMTSEMEKPVWHGVLFTPKKQNSNTSEKEERQESGVCIYQHRGFANCCDGGRYCVMERLPCMVGFCWQCYWCVCTFYSFSVKFHHIYHLTQPSLSQKSSGHTENYTTHPLSFPLPINHFILLEHTTIHWVHDPRPLHSVKATTFTKSRPSFTLFN